MTNKYGPPLGKQRQAETIEIQGANYNEPVHTASYRSHQDFACAEMVTARRYRLTPRMALHICRLAGIGGDHAK